MDKIKGSEDEHSIDNDIQDEDLAMIMRKFKRFMGRKEGLTKDLLRKEK